MNNTIKAFDQWVHESGNFHNYSDDYCHPFYDGFFPNQPCFVSELDYPEWRSYIPRYSMGADWNGDFLCWTYTDAGTKAAERLFEANRYRFLKAYWTHYPYNTHSLDMDYFEWDPDLQFFVYFQICPFL